MTNLRVGLLIALLAAVTGAACGSSSTTSTAPSTVPRCSVSIAQTDLTVPASGGSGTIDITTARECAWTANSNAPWLTFRGLATGQGDGKVDYVAAANSDPATRRGVIELNDKQATVTQAAADCVMQLSDSSESFTQTGGSGTIGVQASGGTCAWTAVSDSGWIVIRSGASGTGNGTVSYDVQPLSGGPRAGTVLVAGLRFSITQSENCTYSVSPTNYTPGSAGGSTTVSITTLAGCPWTAASNVPWATVSQSTGTGSGNVQLAVDAASGPQRIGTALIAGQLVTISQGAGCSYSVDPLNQSFGSQGGPGSATIQAPSGCAWSASSSVPWITLTTATSGSGNGAIGFSVDSLSGPARTGTISVAGTQITVTQGSGCSISISPTSANVPASGGSGGVSVTAGSGCPWTASSNASWLTVTAGASGSGNGTVQYNASATTSVARSAVLTIGGQTFTVNQGSGCSIALSASGANVPGGGAKNTVDVSTAAGCPWTASSGVPWITISSGSSGSGNGTVAYAVDASSVPQRSGVLTIGGQTFTVTQASGCSISLSPNGASVPAAGAKNNVGVTAGAGCPWSASSGVPWMTIAAGASGSGNGTVSYTVDASTGPARSGALTIGGQTFTVNQANGCSYQLSQTSFNVGPPGGTRNVTITVSAGCTWNVTSNVSWIVVTNGQSGNGSGSTEFVVSPNLLGARTGTLTVAGQTVTVNQN
jgi:hypothetical protein